MKNKNIILSCALLGALTLQSCDSYLDIEPKGQALLNTTEDYLGLLEDVSPNYDISDSWYMCNEASWRQLEELKSYTYPMKSVGYFWDESFDRANYTIDSDLYNECYNRITKYNALIDGINDAKGSDEDKQLGMAQAKLMRAYNYFFLVNTFAKPYDPATAYDTNGIIVREHMFSSIEDKGVQQSVGYTYDFMQKDIDDAIAGLPHNASNAYRPDRTLGLAFKAKVQLFRRQYDDCIQTCEEALKEAKEAGHKLWDMNTEYKQYAPALKQMGYPEYAIDAPQYAGMNDQVESIWKERVTHTYNDPEQLIYLFCTNQGDPYPMYVTKPVLDLFGSTVAEKNIDLRYRYCIRYKAYHATAPEGDQDFATLSIKWNPCGMRLSEVYLMLAECYARKGDAESIQKAMDYLDDLRSCRLIKGKYEKLTATDKDTALRLVREERKRELFLTCNGFFDMRRFMTEFNETETKTVEGKTYTLKPDSHLLTFPFPQKAMQTSDLIQNSK